MSFFCFVFSPTSLFIDVTSYQVKSIYRFKSIGRPWISQATQRRLRFNKLHALSLPFFKNKFNTIIFFPSIPFLFWFLSEKDRRDGRYLDVSDTPPRSTLSMSCVDLIGSVRTIQSFLFGSTIKFRWYNIQV